MNIIQDNNEPEKEEVMEKTREEYEKFLRDQDQRVEEDSDDRFWKEFKKYVAALEPQEWSEEAEKAFEMEG